MTAPRPVLDTFLEIVRIPSESRKERAVFEYCRARLEALGFAVREDDAGAKLGGECGNLIATLEASEGGADRPVVLLSAHMDRVMNHGHITPVVDLAADRVISDGTSILGADDVAGLASILEGLERLKAAGESHGKIVVVFSICEEAGLLGARELDFPSLGADMAFVFDASGDVGRITNAAPSTTDVFVTFKGRKAHAGSAPEKGINALKVAATALAELPDGRLAPNLTANIGIFRGGEDTNVVCDRAELSGEVRSSDNELLEATLEREREIFTRAAERFGAEVEINFVPIYRTYEVPAGHPVIELAARALTKIGKTVELGRAGGGSDANHFNANGIPAVCIGCGHGGAHTNEEWQRISALEELAEVAKALLVEVR